MQPFYCRILGWVVRHRGYQIRNVFQIVFIRQIDEVYLAVNPFVTLRGKESSSFHQVLKFSLIRYFTLLRIAFRPSLRNSFWLAAP
jgi:hypothetical protein